jgi:hypothetical protein
MNTLHKFISEFKTLENQTTLKKILSGITYFSIFGLCLFIFVEVPYFIGYLALKNPNWHFERDEQWGTGFVVIALFLVLAAIHIPHIALYVNCIMSTNVTKKLKKEELGHIHQNEDLWFLSETFLGYDHENNLYSYQYSYLPSGDVMRIAFAYLTSFSIVCFLLCVVKVFYAMIIYFFGSFVIDMTLILAIMIIKNIRMILSKSK